LARSFYSEYVCIGVSEDKGKRSNLEQAGRGKVGLRFSSFIKAVAGKNRNIRDAQPFKKNV
jgi:hypothetical protein